MLTDFPNKKFYNSGGYRSFNFVPYQDILSFPMISAGKALVSIDLWQNKSWINGYATAETLQLIEEPQVDSNGTYYNITVGGFIPGDKPELIDLVGEMSQYRYVLLVKDRGNYQRLVGTPNMPLDFVATFNSGKAITDNKGFDFQFTGQSLFRSPVYNW